MCQKLQRNKKKIIVCLEKRNYKTKYGLNFKKLSAEKKCSNFITGNKFVMPLSQSHVHATSYLSPSVLSTLYTREAVIDFNTLNYTQKPYCVLLTR